MFAVCSTRELSSTWGTEAHTVQRINYYTTRDGKVGDIRTGSTETLGMDARLALPRPTVVDQVSD